MFDGSVDGQSLNSDVLSGTIRRWKKDRLYVDFYVDSIRIKKSKEAAEAEAAVPLEDPLSDDPENRMVVGCELDRAPGQFSGSKHGPNSLKALYNLPSHLEELNPIDV